MSGVIQGYFQGGRPRLGISATAQPKAAATTVQRQGNATPLPDNLRHVGRGGLGRPLPDLVQKKMESFFGANFADVRVHVGAEAPAIGALAFTLGSNIYFAPGQYDPMSPRGQQLIGHELAHVVQQRQGRVRNPFGSGIAIVQDPILERQADQQGQRAAMMPVPG